MNLKDTYRKALTNPLKVKTVMQEFKNDTLRSGSTKGPKVTDRKQALAIALNQARK